MDLAARSGTGLRDALQRAAAARPHVLLAAAVGGAAVRLAVEAELAERGWPAAIGPADADLLVVAGSPGPQLGAVLDTVWTQVPAPRARAEITGPGSVSSVLDAAVAMLREPRSHQADRRGPPRASRRAAHARDSPSDGEPTGQHGDEQGGEHAQHGGGHDEHSQHGGGPEGHSQHGGGQHDMHGGMDLGMAMPGGVAMADVGPDRDGLMLDRLHVALGPVLADWPAGLVVRVVLQGDVVQQAEAAVLDAGAGNSFWDEPRWQAAAGLPVSRGSAARRRATRDLDSLARLLAVAGWEDQSAWARRLRDRLVAGECSTRLAGSVSALARRVSRSRTLRWLTRGIPAGDADVWGRLRGLASDALYAVSELDDDLPWAPDGPARPTGIDELASQLVGLELAAARLVVAALDPDTDAVALAGHREASRG